MGPKTSGYSKVVWSKYGLVSFWILKHAQMDTSGLRLLDAGATSVHGGCLAGRGVPRVVVQGGTRDEATTVLDQALLPVLDQS